MAEGEQFFSNPSGEVEVRDDIHAYAQSLDGETASAQWIEHMFGPDRATYMAVILIPDRRIIWGKSQDRTSLDGFKSHNDLLKTFFGTQEHYNDYVAIYAFPPASPDGQDEGVITIAPRNETLNGMTLEAAAYFKRSLGDKATDVRLEVSGREGDRIKEVFVGELANFTPPGAEQKPGSITTPKRVKFLPRRFSKASRPKNR